MGDISIKAEQADYYWESVKRWYKKLLLEKLKKLWPVHVVLVYLSLGLGVTCLVIEFLAYIMQKRDPADPFFYKLYILLALAVLSFIFLVFIDKRINKLQSPSLWIEAINGFISEEKEKGNAVLTIGEIYISLINDYRMPEKNRKAKHVVKIIIFIFCCFCISGFESLIIIQGKGFIINVINNILVFLLGKYIDKVEDTAVHYASNDLLYNRMKKESVTEIVMELQKNNIQLNRGRD